MAPSVPERPGAQQWVPAEPTLPVLREAAQECRGCELYVDATQAVIGDGPTDAPLMLVGEQPGDKEDLAGEPFVGPAGRLLDQALESAGLDPASVFRTNAVKHFRFSGTRGKQRIHKGPSRVHVAACQPWLLAELDVVRPRGLVLLGATAGKSVYGASFKVTQERGRRLDWPALEDAGPVAEPGPVVEEGWVVEEGGAGARLETTEMARTSGPARHRPEWVVPTVHPSSILRSRRREEELAGFVADLRVAAGLL